MAINPSDSRELQREAAEFKRLWASYYYRAKAAEEAEERFFVSIGRAHPPGAGERLVALYDQQKEAQDRWSEAVLELGTQSAFDPDDAERFALGHAHPKLGTLQNSETGEIFEVFLRFRRSRQTPYAYSNSPDGPPQTPYQIQKSFHTLFPLAPYNVMAFAANQAHRITERQWQRIYAILLGWIWCRRVKYSAQDWDENTFHRFIDDLIGQIHLLLLDGVEMKLEGTVHQLKPPPPQFVQYEGELDRISKESHLLHDMENAVMNYGERFFRQAALVWKQIDPLSKFESVPVGELEGQDSLQLSYNPLAEFQARSEVKENLRQLLRDKLNLLTPTERKYFLLHKGQGKRYQDIADECGVSFDTVKKTLAKAQKRLSQQLPPGRAYSKRRTKPEKKL